MAAILLMQGLRGGTVAVTTQILEFEEGYSVLGISYKNKGRAQKPCINV